MDRDQTIREHEAFRNVLQAFAQPGSIRSIAESVDNRDAALVLLASCLLDAESSLSPLWENDFDTSDRLCRLTGCRRTTSELADFVLAGTQGAHGRMHGLRSGEPDYPDQGATLIYLVDEICPEGGSWAWKGPGIPETVCPQMDGLSGLEWDALREANSNYPLGLDAIFLDRRGSIAAMPRSTRLEKIRP